MISFCKVDYKILPLSTNTNMYLPIILFIGLQLELSKKKKVFFLHEMKTFSESFLFHRDIDTFHMSGQVMVKVNYA